MDKFSFVRVATVAQAIRLKKENPLAFFMAGGTDLLILKRNKLIQPQSILYLKGIPGLAEICSEANGGVRIGACATLDAVANHPLIRQNYPPLVRAALAVASSQIRNKATIGGNICLNSRCWFFNRSPFWRAEYPECRKAAGGTRCYVVPQSLKGCFALQSGDTAGPLVALEAKLRLVSDQGERILGVEDFYLGDGIRYLALKAGEILTEVLLPLPKAEGIFRKFRPQNNLDFAAFDLTLLLPQEGTGSKIVVSSVASKPLRARKAEALLDQGAPGKEVVDQAMKEISLVSFVRGDVKFKKQVIAAHMTEAIAGPKIPLRE
jgi:4-hydroxybenzoyl-CoA reductase subunit beta